MPKIRILIVDDHAMVRAGFRSILVAQPDFEIAGEAADGAAAAEQCQRLAPDVVLMDLTMPGRGGIRATQDVRSACPGSKVLVVTMHEDDAYVRQALLAGALGYVLKKALATELVSAIRAVALGKRYVAPTFAKALAEPVAGDPNRPSSVNVLEALTNREREVITEIALGHTTAEIARRLSISDKTVETHRKHISTKLGLRTRADVVRLALEYKLLGS